MLKYVVRLHDNCWSRQGTHSSETSEFKDFQWPPSFSSPFEALNLQHLNSSTFKDQWVPCLDQRTYSRSVLANSGTSDVRRFDSRPHQLGIQLTTHVNSAWPSLRG